MSNELYKRYRPKQFKDLVGQDEAVKTLTSMVKNNSIPHAILLTGSSGVGKTTIARILKSKLNCSDNDFNELNVAESRGIDTVREIKSNMNLSPLGGDVRIYLLDEAARGTNDFQSSLLKVLEDCPNHVYFFLATTDPQKLLPTIRTRCTVIALKSLSDKDMKSLLSTIMEKEGKKVPDSVLNKIVENASGSPRKALVILDSVLHLSNEEEQLNAVLATDVEKAAIDLCRKLMDTRSQWKDVAAIISELKEEPETIRRICLSYASSCAIKGGNKRALAMLSSFRDHWYDCGKAGLILACSEILNG